MFLEILRPMLGAILVATLCGCTASDSSKPGPQPANSPEPANPENPGHPSVGEGEVVPESEPVVLTGPVALATYCGACHNGNLSSNSFRLTHMGETQILDALARLKVSLDHPMSMPPSPIALVPGRGAQMQDPKAIIVAYLEEKLVEVRMAPQMTPDTVAPSFSPNHCYQVKTDWLRFRATLARQIAGQNHPTLTGGYDELSQYLKACDQQLQALEVKSCFHNISNLARVNSLPSSGHKLGFELSDKVYYAQLKAQGQIEGLALPKSGEGIDLSNGIPNNWQEQIAASGARVKALQYRSRTVPNPGNGGRRSYNRLLFLVEGEKYDKWIQFTLPEPSDFSEAGFEPMGDEAPHQLVDMIAIDKTQTPKQIMFAQYWRNSQGQEPMPRLHAFAENLLGFVPAGSQNFADTCYSCHANGMRQLSPQPGSVGAAQLPTLSAFNAKMASYKRLDWIGAITPEAYGPAMGKGAGCTACHNSQDQSINEGLARDSLNSQFSSQHLSHKLLVDLSMPNSKMMHNESSPEAPINVLALQSHVKYLDALPDSARLALARPFVDKQIHGSGAAFPALSQILTAMENLLYFPLGIGTHQASWPGLISLFDELKLTTLSSDSVAIANQRTLWLNQQLKSNSAWYRAEVSQWLTETCPD